MKTDKRTPAPAPKNLIDTIELRVIINGKMVDNICLGSPHPCEVYCEDSVYFTSGHIPANEHLRGYSYNIRFAHTKTREEKRNADSVKGKDK